VIGWAELAQAREALRAALDEAGAELAQAQSDLEAAKAKARSAAKACHGYVAVTEIARRLGVSRQHAHLWIREGP
jgi:hypothetical protein